MHYNVKINIPMLLFYILLSIYHKVMLKCRYNKGFEELHFFLFTDIHILQYIKINENGFNAKSGMPLNFVHKSNLVLS